MKKLSILLALLFVFTLNIKAQDDHTKHEGEKAEGKELPDGTLYGTDITGTTTMIKVSDIFADLTGYEGKTVVVEGTMSEICRSGGCWIMITDGQNYVRALTLHKFILPKDMDISNSPKAVVEGVFAVKEITEEQAKHFAEESGKNPDDVKGPQKMYSIKATGIKILKQ